jgi:hypothetical protein
MKTPAQHNAQIAQKMVDFVPWNDGDATSVKVDGTYIRAQAKTLKKWQRRSGQRIGHTQQALISVPGQAEITLLFAPG